MTVPGATPLDRDEADGLLPDVRYWIDQGTYPGDEIAARERSLAALRAADGGDLAPLLAFTRA